MLGEANTTNNYKIRLRQHRDLGLEIENRGWPGSQVKTRWSEGTWAKMSPPHHPLLHNAEAADFISLVTPRLKPLTHKCG